MDVGTIIAITVIAVLAAFVLMLVARRKRAEGHARRREEAEEEWLCYAGTPETAYDHRRGDARPAWEGEVFLVFVNDDRIVYNWRWEKADSRYRDRPLNFEQRFTQRVYPDDGSDF